MIYSNRAKLASIFLFMWLLNGCGKDDSSSESTTTASAASSILGTWKSGCLAAGSGAYAILTLSNTATESVSEIASYYNDPSCLSVLLIDKAYRTYVVGNSITGLSDTYAIDLTYQKIERTYKNQTLVDSVNKAKGYGFSDWQIDVTKEITGLKYSDTSSTEEQKNQIVYLIFKIDGSSYISADKASGDGSSTDKRPKSLSSTIILKKQ